MGHGFQLGITDESVNNDCLNFDHICVFMFNAFFVWLKVRDDLV